MFPFLLPLLGVGAGLIGSAVSSYNRNKRYRENVPIKPRTYPLELTDDYARIVGRHGKKKPQNLMPQVVDINEPTLEEEEDYDEDYYQNITPPEQITPPTAQMLRDFFDDMSGIERHVVIGADGRARYEISDKNESAEEKEYKTFLRKEFTDNIQWALSKSKENSNLITEQYKDFINLLSDIGQERIDFLKKDENFQTLEDDLKFLQNYTRQTIKQQFDERENQLKDKLAAAGLDVNSSRGLQERALLERERSRALVDNEYNLITTGNSMARDRLATRNAYYSDRKQKWADRLQDKLAQIQAYEDSGAHDFDYAKKVSSAYNDQLQKDAYRKNMGANDIQQGLAIENYNRAIGQENFANQVQESQRNYSNKMRLAGARENQENRQLQQRLNKYKSLLGAKQNEWRANTANAISDYEGAVNYEKNRPATFGERVGHWGGRLLSNLITGGFSDE